MYYFNATPLQQQFQQPQVSAVENHDNLLAIFHAGGDCPSPEQTDREKQATYIAPGLDQAPGRCTVAAAERRVVSFSTYRSPREELGK